MGRIYAGILGPVAFATILGRSLVDGGAVDSTIKLATACLFAFAAIGYIAGSIADSIVTESVRTRFEIALRAREAEAAQSGTPRS